MWLAIASEAYLLRHEVRAGEGELFGGPVGMRLASKTSAMPSASMARSTSIACASRVNSSITLSIFKMRPPAVVSNGKSIAQITFGRIGDIAPTATPMPVGRFFLRRWGTRSPSSRHSRRMRLLLASPQPSSVYSGPRPTNPKPHSDWTSEWVPLTAAVVAGAAPTYERWA